VRVLVEVFDEVDRLLGSERGPNGEPSANDFLTADLLRLIDEFAVGFDHLPELFPGQPGVHFLVSASVFFTAVLVVGQLADDGAIELVSITIDLGS